MGRNKTTVVPSVKDAYLQFLDVEIFAFGGVGVANRPSQGEILFQAVAARTNALNLFTAAMTNGTAAAQLYSLCGIHKLAPTKYDAHAKDLMSSSDEVETLRGCIMVDETVPTVVKRISMGDYDKYVEKAVNNR